MDFAGRRRFGETDSIPEGLVPNRRDSEFGIRRRWCRSQRWKGGRRGSAEVETLALIHVESGATELTSICGKFAGVVSESSVCLFLA